LLITCGDNVYGGASEDNLKQRAKSHPTSTDRHPSKASTTYQKHLLSQSLYPLLTVPLARVANANPGLRLQHRACVRTPRHMAIPHSQTSRKHISPQNQRLMSVVAVPVEAPGARCLCACACGCACSDVHVSVGRQKIRSVDACEAHRQTLSRKIKFAEMIMQHHNTTHKLTYTKTLISVKGILSTLPTYLVIIYPNSSAPRQCPVPQIVSCAMIPPTCTATHNRCLLKRANAPSAHDD
jgi:hypothetical protein